MCCALNQVFSEERHYPKRLISRLGVSNSRIIKEHRIIWTRKLLSAAKVTVDVRVGHCMECSYMPASYGLLEAQ